MGWVENIVGKRENAGYQHFLLFPQFFSEGFSFRVIKSGLCGKGLKTLWEKEKNINSYHFHFSKSSFNSSPQVVLIKFQNISGDKGDANCASGLYQGRKHS